MNPGKAPRHRVADAVPCVFVWPRLNLRRTNNQAFRKFKIAVTLARA